MPTDSTPGADVRTLTADWAAADPRRRVYARHSPDSGRFTVQLWWVRPDGSACDAFGHGATEGEAVADALSRPGVPPARAGG